MSYRSRFEMALDVLRSSVEPIRTTRLMYATNINATQLRRIIDDLIARGLMTKQRLKRVTKKRANRLSSNPTLSPYFTFQTSEKGLQFVELWSRLKSLWRKTK